jgi:two-component system, cell cycle sensor histidine kinase and response regulator CckA
LLPLFHAIIKPGVGFFNGLGVRRSSEESGMQDEDKSKEQLTTELQELRQRLAELENEKAEHKRESKSKLEAALASMNDAVFISDADGRFIDFNDAFATFHKFKNKDESLKALVGLREIVDLYLPNGELAPLDVRPIPRALRGETISNAEFTLRRKDTGETWVGSFSFAPIRDQSGVIVGSVVVGRDITERKQTEEELRHKTALLEAQANSTIDGILVVDIQGKKIFQNRRTIDLWKIPQHIAENDDDTAQVQHVMHATKYPEQFLEKVAYLYSHPNENSRDEIELTDGTVLDRYSAPVLGENGQHYGRIWTFRDITERKKAEEALRESEGRFRQLAENLKQVFWIANRDITEILYVSPAYEEIWGRTCASLYANPKSWIDSVHPEDLCLLSENLANRGSGPHSVEYRIVRPDGSIRWIIDRGFPVRDETGEIYRYAGIAEDISERKEAEQTVRSSEAKFRSYIESAPLAIFVADREGRMMDCNPAAESLFGYDAGRLRNMHIMDIHPEADHEEVLRTFATLLGTGHVETECRMTKYDGQLFWVSLHAVMISDELSLGYCEDITERKRNEEALFKKHLELQETAQRFEQSMSMLQLVIESIPVRVFWKDKDSRYLGCNSLFARDAGLSDPRELLGKDDFAMKWVEEAELYRANDREVMESGLPRTNIVEPQTTPAGPKIWLNTSKAPLLLPNGEVFGVLGVYEDVTEHRQVEEALGLRESYLTAIIENQPGLTWLKDAEGRFLSVNQAFVRSCGRQRHEEIVGKTDLDIWPRELAEKYRRDDEEVMRQHTSVAVEELIFDQGAAKWFQTFKTPVFTTDGQVLGTCGFALDVTERKQAEEERRKLEDRLQRAEKMEALGTMAGGVAHDLNNVLGVVVGYSELLLDDLEESSSARSEAVEILKGGQRAAAIVQDLLSLARRGIQDRKVLNLNDILLECQKSPQFANVLSYHCNVKIKTDFETDLLNLSGSSVHLEKSFMNLVTNAAESMPNGGMLTIKTENRYLDKPISGYDEVREGDYVVLSVSDTGEGIPAGNLKRIFEPFYTKKVMGRSGTGLGLAVVWGTVKDHLGYVNVESKEGKGTTFTLYFPVTREGMSQKEATISAAEYKGNGECVLVVDDVSQQRELAERMLTKLDYKVTTVSSGEEAVEYLLHNAVDLVVLDMIMDPGMDGLDTYAKILEFHPHQRAIIVSGFSETERVSKAQALGAGAYVKKPYVLVKLGLAVRKELDRQA